MAPLVVQKDDAFVANRYKKGVKYVTNPSESLSYLVASEDVKEGDLVFSETAAAALPVSAFKHVGEICDEPDFEKLGFMVEGFPGIYSDSICEFLCRVVSDSNLLEVVKGDTSSGSTSSRSAAALKWLMEQENHSDSKNGKSGSNSSAKTNGLSVFAEPNDSNYWTGEGGQGVSDTTTFSETLSSASDSVTPDDAPPESSPVATENVHIEIVEKKKKEENTEEDEEADSFIKSIDDFVAVFYRDFLKPEFQDKVTVDELKSTLKAIQKCCVFAQTWGDRFLPSAGAASQSPKRRKDSSQSPKKDMLAIEGQKISSDSAAIEGHLAAATAKSAAAQIKASTSVKDLTQPWLIPGGASEDCVTHFFYLLPLLLPHSSTPTAFLAERCHMERNQLVDSSTGDLRHFDGKVHVRSLVRRSGSEKDGGDANESNDILTLDFLDFPDSYAPVRMHSIVPCAIVRKQCPRWEHDLETTRLFLCPGCGEEKLCTKNAASADKRTPEQRRKAGHVWREGMACLACGLELSYTSRTRECWGSSAHRYIRACRTAEKDYMKRVTTYQMQNLQKDEEEDGEENDGEENADTDLEATDVDEEDGDASSGSSALVTASSINDKTKSDGSSAAGRKKLRLYDAIQPVFPMGKQHYLVFTSFWHCFHEQILDFELAYEYNPVTRLAEHRGVKTSKDCVVESVPADGSGEIVEAAGSTAAAEGADQKSSKPSTTEWSAFQRGFDEVREKDAARRAALLSHEKIVKWFGETASTEIVLSNSSPPGTDSETDSEKTQMLAIQLFRQHVTNVVQTLIESIQGWAGICYSSENDNSNKDSKTSNKGHGHPILWRFYSFLQRFHADDLNTQMKFLELEQGLVRKYYSEEAELLQNEVDKLLTGGKGGIDNLLAEFQDKGSSESQEPTAEEGTSSTEGGKDGGMLVLGGKDQVPDVTGA